LAKGINDEGRPVNLTSNFLSNETIYLSVVIKGRPTSGLVGFTFRYRDQQLVQSTVDVSPINKGTIFSFGQDTYTWSSLIQKQPFALSTNYFADVTYNGEKLRTLSFSIVPPAHATPSKLLSATLCKGYQGDYIPTMPTTTFDPTEEVYFVGRADMGIETWFQADWYINGQLETDGTGSFVANKNLTNYGFSFLLRPVGSYRWPAGQHYVVLTMNDQEVGRYEFVTSGLPVGLPSTGVPPVGMPPTGVPPVGTPPPVNPSSM
jgi:hypothetical protein